MSGTLKEEIKNCSSCKLALSCNSPVPGVGNEESEVMFLGEAPGENEDESGVPFVGRAGGVLTAAIEFLDLEREDVYITNIVKCRPPANRNPEKSEIRMCTELWLKEELNRVKPKVIVALGKFAYSWLTQRDVKILKESGKPRVLYWNEEEVMIFPLPHPAWVIRGGMYDGRTKKETYREYLKKLKVLLGNEEA